MRVPNVRFRIGDKTVMLPEGTHSIGRMADCWLVLDDDMVSRYHARLHVGPMESQVEDLGSRNGTYVNGERVEGRRALRDGDRIRIGRELIAVLGFDSSFGDVEDNLRRTLAPGEDTQFPSLIGQLVEKSLRAGKIKDAERYATALTSQLMSARVPASHPAADSCNRCLLALADRTSGGVWIDRLFKLYATQSWIMTTEVVDAVRHALDRIPRIPGTGIADYEQRLRLMAKEGTVVPDGLTENIAELADSYGGG
jgi:hypothetical protein